MFGKYNNIYYIYLLNINNMDKKNLIYGLRDPRNDVYYYIGKTTVGINRPLQHLKHSHSREVNKWVRELNSYGYDPIIDIIEDSVELHELRSRELYWITYYKEINPELLNSQFNVTSKITEYYELKDNELEVFIKIMGNFPKVVKGWRKRYSIDQETLANKLHIARSTLSKLENGGNVSLEVLVSLATFLQEKSIASEV